jgi:hypothetical protein
MYILLLEVVVVVVCVCGGRAAPVHEEETRRVDGEGQQWSSREKGGIVMTAVFGGVRRQLLKRVAARSCFFSGDPVAGQAVRQAGKQASKRETTRTHTHIHNTHARERARESTSEERDGPRATAGGILPFHFHARARACLRWPSLPASRIPLPAPRRCVTGRPAPPSPPGAREGGGR